jgi:phosphatidylglycerophosphate synthase
MQNKNLAKEIPGLVVTGARYAVAERIARKVSKDEPVAVDLAGFVVADILDGAILRKFDADTPLRRVADGVVDHLSMIGVGFEAAKKYPDSKLYLGILVARAALVGGANALHMAKTGEVTKGQNKQRAANLATAAFGLVALTGNKKATHVAGVIASGISILTAIPHLRNIGKRNESGIRKF